MKITVLSLLLLLFSAASHALDGIEIKLNHYEDADTLRQIFEGTSQASGQDFKITVDYENESSRNAVGFSLPFRATYYGGVFFTQWLFSGSKEKREFKPKIGETSGVESVSAQNQQMEYTEFSIAFLLGFFVPINNKSRFFKLAVGGGLSYLDFEVNANGVEVTDNPYYGYSLGKYFTLYEIEGENTKYKFLEISELSAETEMNLDFPLDIKATWIYTSNRLIYTILSYTYYWR